MNRSCNISIEKRTLYNGLIAELVLLNFHSNFVEFIFQQKYNFFRRVYESKAFTQFIA